MNKIISIVIPVFNAELYIEHTIRSILNQTFQDFEIIIINDGSTDNSLKIIEKTALDDERINFISILNSGVSNARNVGLKLLKTKYVLFLDADDILSENFIETRVSFLELNKIYSICGSSISTFSMEGVYSKTIMHAPVEDGLKDILLYQPTIASIPSNLIIRTEFLIENNIQFEKCLNSTADKYFLLELFKAGAISKNIDGAPLYYRVHSNSMSQKISKKLLVDNLDYFNLTIKNKIIPDEILLHVKMKNYYILAGLSKHLKLYHKTLKYGLKFWLLSVIWTIKRWFY